jgi:hypothetical protein
MVFGPRCTFKHCRLKVRGRGSASSGVRSPSGASPRRLSRRPNARTQPRPRFTRAGGRRRYPAPPIALKRSTPLAGPNAGGDDARTARERGYKPRPQEPHSLRDQVCLEITSLDERDSLAAAIVLWIWNLDLRSNFKALVKSRNDVHKHAKISKSDSLGCGESRASLGQRRTQDAGP